MCKCIGNLIFCLLIVLFTLPVWFMVRIMLFIACICPSYMPTVQYNTKALCGWAWWLMMKFMCCILSLKKEGVDEANKALLENDGKPRLIMMNHNSFMDALCVATLMSSRVGGNMKAFASGHLFDMPFLGGISIGAGHFKIPFASQKTEKVEPTSDNMKAQGSVADFSVDKDAVAESQKGFNDWVRSGHVGAWFPEGRLNPNPNVMQTFRAGGCKVAAEIDCQIYGICFAGFEVFWNRKAPVGGAPANCSIKAFKLCDSSFSLLKELAKGQYDSIDEKEKSLLIANYAQAEFQKKRDEQNADPWPSKLPTPPATETALVEKGEAKA